MDIYRLVFALFILVYACNSDIRKRSVPNTVWLAMAGLGLVFAGYGAVDEGVSFLPRLVFSVTITGAMSYLFFGLGFFGAADAKALICIALLFPALPEFSILSNPFPLFGDSVSTPFPFALMVLLNAAVLAMAVPVWLLFRNICNLGLREFTRNAAMCFVAYRVNIDALNGNRFARLTHAYEEIDGHLTSRYSLGGMPINSKTVQQLRTYHREQKVGAEVWVTPELPFILFISLGFTICCLAGV
ncbi:MAG: A24 family peptidase C-terminal domain-containing protein [Dehalococcoidia bacterium]|nr:A24 family peptidase C-terminal domain-containing protein [Dehalococcoidia bacterium]